MVADSYSARLGLIEMATGNNNNNWGTIFNTSFTDLLDRALHGQDIHAVTGGTLDLSTGTLPPNGPSPVAGFMQTFTGALTSLQVVTFPALSGHWWISNSTSGSFPLHIQFPSGSKVEIPQGTLRQIWGDGTSIFRMDQDRVGSVIYHAALVPPGAMEMDGTSLLRTDHPDLFSRIGTAYGAVDGTHFTLPNTKDTGRFIRSRSGSITLGTLQSNQNKAHTHTGSGNTSLQSINLDHLHTFSGSTSTESNFHTHGFTAALVGGGNPGLTGSAVVGTSNQSLTTANNGQLHTHPFSGTTSGADRVLDHVHGFAFTTSGGSADGTEARPESIAMIACILY